MKNIASFMIAILAYSFAHADCSAPDLSFREHKGLIHGFKVTKIWDDSEVDSLKNTDDTIIKFGDYYFLISPKTTIVRPTKLSNDVSKVSKKLLNSFHSSGHNLGSEKQIFTISDISAYDLTGDSRANLILYHVSPGANQYSGAVGIVNEEWVVLIDPTCY